MTADEWKVIATSQMGARMGVSADEVEVEKLWDAFSGGFVDSYRIKPTVQLTPRQAHAVRLRPGGQDGEVLVAAATGWPREVRVSVRSPNRRPRPLDVANVAARVDVEVDGKQHEADREFDLFYDAALTKAGWTVLRYWNSQVHEALDRVASTAFSAAGLHWTPGAVGDLDPVLAIVPFPDVETALRPTIEALASVTRPVVHADGGLVVFWLPLADRVVPLAYFFPASSRVDLTTTASHALGRYPESAASLLRYRLADLGLYTLAGGDGSIIFRADFAGHAQAIGQQVKELVVEPAARFAALDDTGRLNALAMPVFRRFRAGGDQLIRAAISGKTALVEASFGGDHWTFGTAGQLAGLRGAILRTSAIDVDRLDVTFWAPGASRAIVEASVTRARSDAARRPRVEGGECSLWTGWIDPAVQRRLDT